MNWIQRIRKLKVRKIVLGKKVPVEKSSMSPPRTKRFNTRSTVFPEPDTTRELYLAARNKPRESIPRGVKLAGQHPMPVSFGPFWNTVSDAFNRFYVFKRSLFKPRRPF
jgi:hypothetical protein